MVSREHKKAALHENLQLLRSITNSHALNKASIVVDASNYIEELKQKVERLNQDIATTVQNSITHQHQHQHHPMEVTVESLVKGGFSINVYSEKSCQGLLVSILQVFEDLGLNVIEARVSCTHTFQLQAIGEIDEQGEEAAITTDAQAVKQAVIQAVETWNQSNEQD